MTSNTIRSRFDAYLTSATPVLSYVVPTGTEELLKTDNEYIIISQTLRGYCHLASRLPFDYSGKVLVPEEFKGVPLSRRAVSVSECGNGVALLTVAPSYPPKWEFSTVDGKKNPIFSELKRLDSLTYRRENNVFALEEERLIKRAVEDGTDVKYIVHTAKSQLLSNGTIALAKERRIPCLLITEGLLGSVTQTRPVPQEMALCTFPRFDLDAISIHHKGVILIADNVENPDNLGLVIRTADACGADAVISVGNTAVFNKNCIRAARGAIGRFPVLEYSVGEFSGVINRLKALGYTVYGTSARTDKTARDIASNGGRVFSVSNETNGISAHMAQAAHECLRIPMATGQSSLNVAVAAGIILSQAIRFE